MNTSHDLPTLTQPASKPFHLLRCAMASRLGQSVVVTALMLALVGGVSYATTRQTTPLYHGCYNKKSGILRLLTHAAPRCTRKETAIAWNQTGPQGPVGPQGAPGPTGP